MKGNGFMYFILGILSVAVFLIIYAWQRQLQVADHFWLFGDYGMTLADAAVKEAPVPVSATNPP